MCAYVFRELGARGCCAVLRTRRLPPYLDPPRGTKDDWDPKEEENKLLLQTLLTLSHSDLPVVISRAQYGRPSSPKCGLRY